MRALRGYNKTLDITTVDGEKAKGRWDLRSQERNSRADFP
jgi:hypothetical protein